MKKNLLLYAFSCIAFLSTTFAQQKTREWFITANANVYIPVNNPYKGIYPVLWHDKESNPKLLLGGIGVGVSVYQPFHEKFSWKGQANLSKHTYWDEAYMIYDEIGQPISDFIAGSSDYSLGLTATLHYFLSKRFSVGTGLGGQVLLVSLSRVPDLYLGNGTSTTKDGQVMRNRYYRPFVPMLPLELSLKYEKILFNLRYEHGLLNRLKGDLSKSETDKFSLLTFEVGFRIK